MNEDFRKRAEAIIAAAPAVRSAVLIYSGGLDSTTLLHLLVRWGVSVRCMGVNYGQRHRTELASAASSCLAAGVEFRIVDLHAAGFTPMLGGSSQTDPSVPVPDGHYADETMKKTVVPNRNMVMLSMAMSWAISTKSDAVAYAVHAGDHTIYPDCRPVFADVMSAAGRLADWHEVALLRPLIGATKADIAAVAGVLGVDVGGTWSCYRGGSVHCGQCGTCRERREALQLSGVDDPTVYDSNVAAAEPA